MEDGNEVVGCKHYTQIIKGKRTKRQRHSSPLALTMASSSSSSTAEAANSISGTGGGFSDSSVEFTRGTGEEEEEEDMANCLILLAQGQTPKPCHLVDKLYVYQCKTCDRCFPSFQALGGHRAGHNRPKPTPGERNLKHENTALSLQISDRACLSTHNRSRVHECSICGTGFASGQALGGHMRRHRAMASGGAKCQEPNNPRSILSLDLNLPAPEDDHRPECKLAPLGSKQEVMVFSPSSLVDCHY